MFMDTTGEAMGMTTTMREAWNVYLGGRRVATVDLADSQVPAFRDQLADATADLRLAAWENGTLTTN
jgi:hypothetical protein